MSERIVCKPTPWFLMRGLAMLLMFGVFTVLFYKDGSTGYREKNYSYYAWQTVKRAVADFGEKKSGMSPEEWKAYAAEQEMVLPGDREILPAGTPERVPWPRVLGDYEQMEAGLANQTQVFDRYMEEADLKYAAPDYAYPAKKIFEQWVMFWICLALTLSALFVTIRTLSGKLVLDGEEFRPARGKPARLSDLVKLDLRRWKSKGLAFAWAKTPGGGERKLRIDGLTYGGFRKENGEPAERLMQALRANFSGELIDYEGEDSPPARETNPET